MTRFISFAATILLIFVAGCGSLRPRHAVPPELVEKVQIPGLPGVRLLVHPVYFSTGPVDHFLGNAVARAAATNRALTMLALSGGGADGAFGAGLLRGWSEAGDRPEFDIVTGISTGALIGPYAFLGPAYDAEVERSYTTISDADIYERRGTLAVLKHRDALTSSAPLVKMLEKQITPAVLDAIAAEHRKGRRFYVGTTYLDAECAVVWDMGAIAASGQPAAPALFRDVLLASASIPVAFPPVYFDVEANGKKFDEMHADGGVMTQVFGPVFLRRLMALSGHKDGRIFLIYNAQLRPRYETVQPKLVGIAARSVSLMIKAQGFGDLLRAYAAAQAGNLDFNLASITRNPQAERKSAFDTAFMRELFNDVRQQARDGFPWAKVPPASAVMESH